MPSQPGLAALRWAVPLIEAMAFLLAGLGLVAGALACHVETGVAGTAIALALGAPWLLAATHRWRPRRHRRAPTTGILAVPAIVLGIVQLQYCSGVWYLFEHADYAEHLRIRAMLLEAISGAADVPHFAAFKLYLLPFLSVWNAAWWGLLRGRQPRAVEPDASAPTPAGRFLCAVGVIGSGLMLFLGPVAVFPLMAFGGLLYSSSDGFRQVSDEVLIDTYLAHAQACERLRAMILEDRSVERVGTDNVGEWWRYGRGWEKSGPGRRTTDLATVLADVGLTPVRYREYLRLLHELTAYRVCAAARNDLGMDCEIHLTRLGNVVRSVSKSFLHSPSGEHPPVLVQRPDDPDEERYTALGNGWFLRYLDH